jgi:hypothetical protein
VKTVNLHDGHNRRQRKPWRAEAANGGEPTATARAVADGIVEAFIETFDCVKAFYRGHVEERIELVEKIAGLVERPRR